VLDKIGKIGYSRSSKGTGVNEMMICEKKKECPEKACTARIPHDCQPRAKQVECHTTGKWVECVPVKDS
jgi:hypothetical protein